MSAELTRHAHKGPRAKWVKVPGAFTLVRYMRERRRQCTACGKIQKPEYTYAENNTAVMCDNKACGAKFWTLELPPPPLKPALDVSSARIAARIFSAELMLDRAVDQLAKVAKRIAAHRSRIARLKAALRTPPEVRSARARKALETRQQQRTRKHRAINLEGGP